MGSLFRLEWQTFNLAAGIKISAGLVVMLVLAELTGESWLATALAAMCAWLANTPGPLKHRVGGMSVFALGAVAFVLLFPLIGLDVWPNVVAIALAGFVCTLGLAKGIRGFMVGWSVICWAIYAPFLVASTDTTNVVLAVLLGTGIVIVLNAIGDGFQSRKLESPAAEEENADQGGAPDTGYVLVYALTVAAVLAVTTYYSWTELKTDPTLMVGGAFFVLGFDPYKTWAAGFGRVLGLVGGVAIGLLLADIFGSGLVAQILMIVACGLSFAAFAVHPGAWMFFFMIFVAIGWAGLDSEAFRLTITERFYGEIAGIIAAMAGIFVLLFWRKIHTEDTAD